MKIEIGCQGWNYADWMTKAGGGAVFYPRGTKSNEMLAVYAKAFETVEVDSTFYAVPAIAALENWDQKTPPEFTFSLKMPQEVTHNHALQASSFGVLNEFCERILILKEKLAAVLIQLPPQFEASGTNIENLKIFLRELPKGIRFAIEFRDRSWFETQIFAGLAKHNVAICLTEGNWIPRGLMVETAKMNTADFAYARFMGERDLTRFDQVQRPQNTNLALWHEVLTEITVPTFVYFSNFYEGFAPESANKLKKMSGQTIVAPDELEQQQSLF